MRVSCTRNINIAKSVHIEKESVDTILIVEVIAGDSSLVIQAHRPSGYWPSTLRSIKKAQAPINIQEATDYQITVNVQAGNLILRIDVLLQMN